MIDKTTVAIGLICLSLFPLNAKANQDSITIKYQPQAQHFHISYCFQRAPVSIEAPTKQLKSATQGLTWNGQLQSYNSGYVYLPRNQKGCVSYQLSGDVGANTRRLKQQHPHSLLMKIDELLWQPGDSRNRKLPTVKFIHDKNTAVSAPWQLIERGSLFTLYQMKPSPRYSDGFVAIGALSNEDIQLGKSTLRLGVMPGKYSHKTQLVRQWVETMAASVAKVGGEFPINDVQVLVIMIDGNGGEVPWGQVNRAGGDGVLFVVNGNANEANLYDDWTAAHEFSHLLMPYTPNDRWLSEGFASYHQNISRLKTGLLDEKTAWSKLVAGFERGKKSASKSNAPVLKYANRKNNMQMYWGGAVIALKAEIALQQQTQGKVTLSDALAGLQGCCLGLGRGWSAKQLFTELDRISETDIFSQLYESDVKNASFPQYEKLLTQLGIRKDYYGDIMLNDNAPLASARKKIAEIGRAHTEYN